MNALESVTKKYPTERMIENRLIEGGRPVELRFDVRVVIRMLCSVAIVCFVSEESVVLVRGDHKRRNNDNNIISLNEQNDVASYYPLLFSSKSRASVLPPCDNKEDFYFGGPQFCDSACSKFPL